MLTLGKELDTNPLISIERTEGIANETHIWGRYAPGGDRVLGELAVTTSRIIQIRRGHSPSTFCAAYSG